MGPGVEDVREQPCSTAVLIIFSRELDCPFDVAIPRQILQTGDGDGDAGGSGAAGAGAAAGDPDGDEDSDSELQEIYVQAYACEFFRDDDAAQAVEDGAHLRPLVLPQV